MERIKITPKICSEVRRLAEQYGLKLVLLFGSQASGQTHRESDVDIAVQGSTALSEFELVNMSCSLTRIFETNNIDIVSLHSASPLLRRRIADEARVLYDQTGHGFSAFEIEALRRYAEAKPLFDIRGEKINVFLKTI